MLIKGLLVAGILLFGLLAVRGQPSARHLALRRLLAALVLVFGLVAVLVPSLVTRIANLVGVGRGTDLVVYVLAVSFLLVVATLLQRLTELERKYVDLARHIAVDDAVRNYPTRVQGLGVEYLPAAHDDEGPTSSNALQGTQQRPE